MDKRDYIDLIKVAEAVMRLEKACISMTGCSFDEGESYEIYFLWEVLRRNAAEHFRYTENLDKDMDNYQEFMNILKSEELTPEEKYVRLVA